MCVTRLFIACSAIALLAASTPSMEQMAPYLHAQRLVDIGGRRLNVYCTGSGAPAVILDAGLGDTMQSWYRVQGPLSRYTRVCSYDRAGMGFSDGTTSKRDPNAVVDDLHALLHRAGIAPPYVLVGHSIAGLYEPLFVDRYFSEVAGMVLVDPSRPYQFQRFAVVAPALTKFIAMQNVQIRRCESYVAGGRLTAGQRRYCGFPAAAQDRAACAKEGRGQCALDKVQAAQLMHPLEWRDVLSELQFVTGTEGSNQVQRAQRYYGNLPLIVLTADDGPDHRRGMPPALPKSQAVALWNVWNAMHDTMARYSSRGVNRVISGTSHYIQQDRPAAVIGAVEEVVDQVRARKL